MGLVVNARSGDAQTQLACGAAAGAVAFLFLNPNPAGTAFRLELVLVPAAAWGLALVPTALLGRRELARAPRPG